MHFQVEPGSVTRRTLTLNNEDLAARRLRFGYEPSTELIPTKMNRSILHSYLGRTKQD
jgi:hypothetical protein